MRRISAALVLLFAVASQAYGAVLLFDRTQRAGNVPFDNSTNGFISTDVQAAIEEVNANIIALLAYPIQASYNGNGNVGRHLEIFPGEDTATAPLLVPLKSKLLHVVIQASATTSGAINVYNLTTATVLYTANFSGTAKAVYLNLGISGIHASDELQFIVATAAVNKPKIRIWLQGTP